MKRFLVVLAGIIVVVVLGGGLLIKSWMTTDHGNLDPRVAVVLKLNQILSNPDFQSVADKRKKLETSARLGAGKLIPFQNIKNTEIPGPAGNIPIRIYTPEGPNQMPIIVFYHGGGWVSGSLDTHDHTCRALSKGTTAIVVSVAYRLAPEYPFPAGVIDAYAALQWVAKNAGQFGGDRTRIAVAGDSAGGNIAAVVAQMARNNKSPAITAQVLIYPATNSSSLDTVSYKENGNGFMLLKKNIEIFREMYLPRKDDWNDPKASPLLAKDFKGLPPAIVITAEFDPLRDEGEAYAAKLQQAGVPTVSTRYKGVVHGFVGMGRFIPQADEATDQICNYLRTQFQKR
jgi:acetyl esterase